MIVSVNNYDNLYERNEWLYLQDGLTATILAAQNGHVSVVEMLLERGADIHAAAHVSQLVSQPVSQSCSVLSSPLLSCSQISNTMICNGPVEPLIMQH